MKIEDGDLLKLANESNFDVIVHGCNCFCAMGAGIAKAIRDTWPSAYAVDCATEKGDKEKMGKYTSVNVPNTKGNTFAIVNGYTQYSYASHGVQANYEAIRGVFKKVKEDFGGLRIGYPMIGAGLAGGDWKIISEIIDEELEGEDHTLVRLPQ